LFPPTSPVASVHPRRFNINIMSTEASRYKRLSLSNDVFDRLHDDALGRKLQMYSVVAIVPPDKSTCASYLKSGDLFNALSIDEEARPDGRVLADWLSKIPVRILTNDPTIGWNPKVFPALARFADDCLSIPESLACLATSTLSDPAFNPAYTGPESTIRIVSLSPNEANLLVEENALINMTDKASLYSPAMRLLHDDLPSTIGVCAHSKRGISFVCAKESLLDDLGYRSYTNTYRKLRSAFDDASKVKTNDTKGMKDFVRQYTQHDHGQYASNCFSELDEEEHDTLLQKGLVETLRPADLNRENIKKAQHGGRCGGVVGFLD
jgi:hypothetical protein